MHVRPEVAEGEEDAEGLLHAEEAVEGPLAVELDDGEVGGDPFVGDDVLAGVVAFAGAGPEEETVKEGCNSPEADGLVETYRKGQSGWS